MLIMYPFFRYTPPLSAVVKFAWVQYMSFFIVVAFLLYQINSFVFGHKVMGWLFSLSNFIRCVCVIALCVEIFIATSHICCL